MKGLTRENTIHMILTADTVEVSISKIIKLLFYLTNNKGTGMNQCIDVLAGMLSKGKVSP